MGLSILGSATIPALQEVVKFTQARHGVLAGNVANWDTPGYRTRDLSLSEFQRRLKEVMADGALQSSHSQHASPGLMVGTPDERLQSVDERLEHVLYHDESNVGIEQQVVEVAKNQSMHNLAIALLTLQFRQVSTAISERV